MTDVGNLKTVFCQRCEREFNLTEPRTSCSVCSVTICAKCLTEHKCEELEDKNEGSLPGPP